MITNPVDKLECIIKILENELKVCNLNYNALDSSPILEMVRDELKELQGEVNDDWSVMSIVRRCKIHLNYSKADRLVKVKPRSPARQVLSRITLAMREEENRYDSKSYSFWFSPVWRTLNEAKGILTKELSK